MIFIRHDLNKLIDVVNMMPTEIESIIASSIENNKTILQSELITMFGGGEGEVIVENEFDGNSFIITVDGVNQYQMYYTTGMSMEDLQGYIENRVEELTQSAINEGGYGNGN